MPRLKFNETSVKAVQCDACGRLHDITSTAYIKIAGWIGQGNFVHDTSKGVPVRYACDNAECFPTVVAKFNTTLKTVRKRKVKYVELPAVEENISE